MSRAETGGPRVGRRAAAGELEEAAEVECTRRPETVERQRGGRTERDADRIQRQRLSHCRHETPATVVNAISMVSHPVNDIP